MIKFSKKAMEKMAKKINTDLRNDLGYPNTITAKDMDNKTHKLTKEQYMGLFESQNIFLLKNGRYPNYVKLVSTSKNPLVMDYQNNGYTCCPTSLSMASQLLFNYKSEQLCAIKLGTITGKGTNPSSLVNNAPKLGFKAEIIKRNYNNVKKAIKKGHPVIAHIQTRPATCLNYTGDYGHYILIYGAYRKGLTKYYKIADPTKGLKVCKASIIDKATNGRSINYYEISPK